MYYFSIWSVTLCLWLPEKKFLQVLNSKFPKSDELGKESIELDKSEANWAPRASEREISCALYIPAGQPPSLDFSSSLSICYAIERFRGHWELRFLPLWGLSPSLEFLSLSLCLLLSSWWPIGIPAASLESPSQNSHLALNLKVLIWATNEGGFSLISTSGNKVHLMRGGKMIKTIEYLCIYTYLCVYIFMRATLTRLVSYTSVDLNSFLLSSILF